LVVTVTLLVLLGFPRAALAAETIGRYQVAMTVDPDGVLEVREDISYDFGSEQRHGIFRDLPTTLRYDERYDRVYPLEVLRVLRAEGGGDPRAEPYAIEEIGGGMTRIRVGDPDVTVTGLQRYVLVYRVEGALNAFVDHDELYWNAIGTSWDVPIADARATVEVPGVIQGVACYRGPEGSRLACDRARATGSRATFGQPALGPYEGLSVVVAIPKGAVTPTPTPILREADTFLNAFRVTPIRAGLALVLLGVLIWAVLLFLWRTGRDRRFRGSAVDQVMGGHEGDEPVPMGDADASAPVEFAPPEDLRPGEIGTLVDERANVLDVSATIVDLAVRGHLMIQEIPKEGWFGKPDWRLIRLEEPENDLLRYERELLSGLFRDGGEVTLSSLRTEFVDRLRKVQAALYADVVNKGWFSANPDTVRTRWRLIGVSAVVASIALTVGLAKVRLGIFGVPFVVGALVLLLGAAKTPARTAKGTAILRRVRGFRTVIEKAETNISRWAEQEGVFTRYLPYAIVFGCTEEWAKAFAQLGEAATDTAVWYVSSRPFAYSTFADSIDGFTVNTSGTIASTPAGSGSSGFGGGGSSGGGGGGGGGGSW
jgi:uncharacterized membrane protein YgcG